VHNRSRLAAGVQGVFSAASGSCSISIARFRPLEIVDLDDFGAVGGVGVCEVEDFRIVAGLLHGIDR
jgi:hypothetical protein